MRTSNFLAIASFSSLMTLCQAQTVTTVPAPTPYTVVFRDANSRVWERTTYELSPSGQVIPQVHSYKEVATGLCYPGPNGWLDSQEQINVLPDGSAAATNGQHQAYFPADIYNGVITLVTPDGLQLESQPIGLSYDDGTNTVLIAELTNSVGQLISSNQVYAENDPANLLDLSGNSVASDQGTAVHTFLARKWEAGDPRLGPGLGGLRWGNRQIRTIYLNMTGNTLPNIYPFTIRPDLADINSPTPIAVPATKGNVFEIKPGILSLANNPGLTQQEILATANQLAGYIILNNMMNKNIWTQGRLQGRALCAWPDFATTYPSYGSSGTLVTMDISQAIPGVIIYDFLPTQQALEYAADATAFGAGVLGAALAEQYGITAVIKVTVSGMLDQGAAASGVYVQQGIGTDLVEAQLTGGL